MTEPAASAKLAQTFWDNDTKQKQAEPLDLDDLSLLGTVTTDPAVVRLKDQLEKAQLQRLIELSSELRVLDLGGGAGRMSLWLAPHVKEVTLVDTSGELLEAARRGASRLGVTNLNLHHGSVLDCAPDRPFDVVLALDVACHLDDAELGRFVEVCAHAVTSEGCVVLKEPVSTDGVRRADVRYAGAEKVYQCAFRPREFYGDLFSPFFRLSAQQPSCAHFIPWFLGGTNGAVRATRSQTGGTLFGLLSPLLLSLDPPLQRAEKVLRSSPLLERVLAPVEVVHDFYLFCPRVARPAAHNLGRPELTVVVIAYNEEECLAPVVEELAAELRSNNLRYELLLVDDGSSDGTLSIMERLAAADPAVKYRHQRNLGIGGALRTGFDAASGEFVSWIPADGQIAPSVVSELFRRRQEGTMLTTVYRTRDDPWYRTAISRTLNSMIRLRTGQRARSGGNYLFRRDAWESCGPRADDSMMLSSVFRHQLREAGESIVEVEVDCRARQGGRSKVLNPRTIGRTLLGLVGARRLSR